MNKYLLFFTRLIALILIFLAIDFLIGKVMNHFYFSETSGPDYSITYTINSSKDEVLMMGSSRCSHHYVPSIMEKTLGKTAFNTGADGQGILFNDAVLKCVLKRYTPKCIILDITDRDFIYSQSSYEKLSVLLPYYAEHKQELESTIDLISPYEKIKLVSKTYPYNSKFISMILGNKSNPSTQNKGYVPLIGSMPNDIEVTIVQQENIDSIKVNAYKNFISTLKSSSVKLVVVVSPYYQKSSSETIKIASRIAGEMNVEFWDYSSDENYFHKKELFKDHIHLNAQGSEMFTQMLANRVKTVIN
ncbi:MAG: hypothetical protein JST55_04860 [Bacteroidetes bacterium]|nr:hypothetical protein [Bacteroidota bacterium]